MNRKNRETQVGNVKMARGRAAGTDAPQTVKFSSLKRETSGQRASPGSSMAGSPMEIGPSRAGHVRKNGEKSLKGRIYNDLKDKIIFSELLPGSTIVETDLCEEYKVSRTPVREALLELEKEGFVDIEPRKSTRVSKISIQEMNDIIKARLIIEVQIVRSLTEPLGERLVSRLEDIKRRFDQVIQSSQQGSLEAFLRLDFEFHHTLILLSNNELLEHICRSLLQKSVRQWYFMCIHVEKRMAESIREHEEIIDDLVGGDCERAAVKLESHIKTYYSMMYFC
jgi:GntR family transcriptional regulator, rspAB operon transcriptional repressor